MEGCTSLSRAKTESYMVFLNDGVARGILAIACMRGKYEEAREAGPKVCYRS